MDDANRLTIKLLGQFGVWHGGQPLSGLRTDAVRALIAYLAIHQGAPQRRDTLAALLSPDRSDKDARAYLRKQIARLRQALGAQVITAYFQIDRKSVTLLQNEAVTVDLVQFATLLTEAQQHPHRRIESCPVCVERLQQAVTLYGGELMRGMTFQSESWEAWLLAEREKAGRQALQTLQIWGAKEAALGRWDVALSTAQRQLEIEPWLEAAHRLAIEAHWRMGDRHAALAQLERCQTVLWEELGVEPEAETLALRGMMDTAWKMEADDAQLSPAMRHPSALPSPGTPFFGRKQLLVQLQTHLTNPANRLVTLLGEGGIGKSRLAIETGRQLLASFADGVWFVSLVEVTDAVDGEDAIVTAIAQALDFNFHGKTSPLTQLVNFLREAELLLILDQLEHLIDSAEIVLKLIRRCRNLAILATSRIVLGFIEEIVVPVGALSTDVQPEATDPTVALFVDRANRASGWQLHPEAIGNIVQIMQLVAGNTLAVELAASWTRALSVEQIVVQIQKSADFLATRSRNMPARHRSMRAVFESSWALLTPSEQRLFGKLSVFRGGFTLEAVQTVVNATLWDLGGLIEKSLVQRYGERYMIHELLRVFSAEKQPPTPTLRLSHAVYYTDYLIQLNPRFISPEPQSALRLVQRDEANIWRAWTYALTRRPQAMIVACIVTLGRYFLMQGRIQEAYNFFKQALIEIDIEADAIRGELMTQQVRFLNGLGRLAEALEMAELATPIVEQTRDEDAQGRLIQVHSDALIAKAQFKEAARLAFTGIEMDVRPETRLFLLRLLGLATMHGARDFELARSYLNKGLALSQEIQFYWAEALMQNNLAYTWLWGNEFAPAQHHFEAAERLYEQLADPLGRNMALLGLAATALQTGQFDQAVRQLKRGLATAEKMGWDHDRNRFRYNLGFAYLQVGLFADADTLLRQAGEFCERNGLRRDQILAYLSLGRLCCQQEQLPQAELWYQQALELSRQSHQSSMVAYALDGLGRTALARAQWDVAGDYFQQAIELRRSPSQRVLCCESESGLLQAHIAQGRFTQAAGLIDPILAYVAGSPELDGAEEPLSVYLLCFRVLQALDDARAPELLATAVNLLRERANRIEDEMLREAFLNAVPNHREILRLSLSAERE